MELTAIEAEGRRARLLGCQWADNPYYHPYEMPGATGETFELWQEKLSAWQRGWTETDRQQPGLAKNDLH